jgi:PTS system fructose-specific IIC component
LRNAVKYAVYTGCRVVENKVAEKKRRKGRTVRDVVPSEVSVLDLKATTKEEAITELLNVLVIAGILDLSRETTVRDSILERERVASTGIGNGIAIPHAKSKFADGFGLAVGLSHDGIDFNAYDDIPAFVVALWVCPPAATQEHLALMRGIASIAKDPNVAGTLAGCRDKRGFLDFLEQIAIEEKR